MNLASRLNRKIGACDKSNYINIYIFKPFNISFEKIYSTLCQSYYESHKGLAILKMSIVLLSDVDSFKSGKIKNTTAD